MITIYNASFHDDYVKYGECPAYGRSKEEMIASVKRCPKGIILADEKPVGVASVQALGDESYYVGCLCVIPECQGKGDRHSGIQAHRGWKTELEAY